MTATPVPANPAPPLPPIRRSDGSATRSPRSRRGAARLDVDLVGGGTVGPETTWLGTDADYQEWVRGPGPQPDDQRRAPDPAPSFDALVLAESSLAEGPNLTTVRDQTDRPIVAG